MGVSPQGVADPSTALVVLDNPSDMAVDAIDFPDDVYLALFSGNFLDILCDTVYFALLPFFVWYFLCNIACSAVSWYHFEFIAEKVDVFSPHICYQRFFCG